MNNSFFLNEKYIAPTLPENYLEKGDLMRQLDNNDQKATIFLTAPQGYGKSTTARGWLEHSKREFIWINLDEYDNHAVVFFKLVATGLASLQEDNEALLEILASDAFQAQPVASTIQMLSLFRPSNKKYALVLDNMHYLSDPQIRRDFNFLLRRLPTTFITLILTKNELVETNFILAGGVEKCGVITQADLTFSATDIKDYFKKFNLHLVQKNAQSIQSLTEGAPGIICALKNPAEVPLDQPYENILTYYIESQLWPKLSEENQNFLMETAILPTISPETATLLTHSDHCQEILAGLTEQFLFVTEVSPQHYQYHEIFREFLNEQLLKRPKEQTAQLYHSAVHYYLAHDDIFLARNLSLKSGNADLIRQANQVLAITDETSRNVAIEDFIRRFSGFPKISYRTIDHFPYPYLLSQYVSYYFMKGNAKMVRLLLDEIQWKLPLIAEEYPDFFADSVLISFSDYRKNCFQVFSIYRKQAIFKRMQKRMEWSSVTLQLPFFHRSSRNYTEFTNLAVMKWPTGIVKILFGPDAQTVILLLQAGLLYEKGQLTRAQQLLAKIEFYPNTKREFIFCSYLQRAVLYNDLNQTEQLQHLIKEIEAHLGEWKNPLYAANFAAFKANLSCQLAHKNAAETWLEVYGCDEPEQIEIYNLYQYFATARALIVLNEPEKAKDLLEKMEQVTISFQRTIDAAEVRVLLASLEWRLRNKTKALNLMEAALSDLQPLKFIQVVAAEGDGVLPILKKLQQSVDSQKITGLQPKYLRKVLEAAENYSQQKRNLLKNVQLPMIRLSKQQLLMLSYLDKGYQNQEIAQLTNLTIHTVKFHLSAAYKKLNVENGKEAVKLCHERGLFSK